MEIFHDELNAWIEKMRALCTPQSIHICDGSKDEYDTLCQKLVDDGVFHPLEKRPGSFWCHSDPEDVARVEGRTFICSEKKIDAGPTNNWADPKQMKEKMHTLFQGCMKGRTMYVIPYCMGPVGSKMSIIGIEITDSLYVAVNMYIMTRMGKPALEMLGNDGEFIPGLHSVGVPLAPGEKGPTWPCRPDDRYVVHFPENRSIYSFGSGYGGNALLGKKCLALRIASVKARDEGWLAEHMLILGITNPEGVKKYICAAFPSACGKTNMAMITFNKPGWKTECVGDDIAWMHYGDDGQLYAINPENGYFGVAPGTSYESNYNAMKTIETNTLFTNVAKTDDGDIWWEGIGSDAPENLTDWKGRPWDKNSGEKASHPNARFTTPAHQCPIVSPEMNNPNGVPISAIIFGGRRKSLEPLIYEAFNWQHGTYLGAALSSEMTAAAKGNIGELRHDPFAMLPFCGYNMGDYYAHWLSINQHHSDPHLPKIFHINWFKKDENENFLWPGFSDNTRILEWIFNRCDSSVEAQESPLGYIPHIKDLNLDGLNLSDSTLKKLFEIDKKAWSAEIAGIETYFEIFGSHLPQ
ncbi:MAG: phosphoenolpyruvate carboxykinase (GTP), partial [Simkaniaceae bacterium]|nr:phosphoenolpyruvate carboxykinase (GTP) [Simkaniaceae bacterium]